LIPLDFRLGLLGMGLLALMGCSVDYSSDGTCLNLGDCFYMETCRFDKDGVGQCIPITPNRNHRGGLDDASIALDAMMSTDALLNMNLETGAMNSTIADASQTENNKNVTGSEMATPATPGLECPSSDEVVNARLECSYPETDQRRDYCQYLVTESSCESFCSSLGLFTCSTPLDCCWNNATESSCTIVPAETWDCTRNFESLICRCFETAQSAGF
jgi:hypothetical protein